MRLLGKTAPPTGATAPIETRSMGFGGAAANLLVHDGPNVTLAHIGGEAGERVAVALRTDAHHTHFDATSEQHLRRHQ